MKKLLLLITGFVLSLTIPAQGKKRDNGKEKDKSKNEKSINQKDSEQIAKEKRVNDEHSKKIWEGTYDNSSNGPKPSKNQPARVRSSFQKDYPNASNISWSKYRGDWAATFGNGTSMSTALYHANGDRRDTRTLITRNETPRNVIDSILHRRHGTWLEDIIKIETPGTTNDIFRIKDIIQGKPQYFYYDTGGNLAKYNY
ncbi:MAG TPA: hypothetical protein VFP97_10150 [Chitinophagaceae bacterium]|nr:hypothetical protein [Chitinophagaceae bacterium]